MRVKSKKYLWKESLKIVWKMSSETEYNPMLHTISGSILYLWEIIECTKSVYHLYWRENATEKK